MSGGLAANRAAAIINDAGGRVVGRTRLQKITYLLYAAGLEDNFHFTYKHYGPFSNELASATRDASLLGLVNESEHQTYWGGTYSIYVSVASSSPPSSNRRRLATEAASADPIQLELAATALFLFTEGYSDPWAETARRKPEKTDNGRLDGAKELYRKLSAIDTPTHLPQIA